MAGGHRITDDHPVEVRQVATETRRVEELCDALLPAGEPLPGQVADPHHLAQGSQPAHPRQQVAEVRGVDDDAVAQLDELVEEVVRRGLPAVALERAFERMAISKQSRAETVSFEQFVGLSRDLATELPHG